MSSSSQHSSSSDCPTCITLITHVSTTTFTPSPFFVTTTFLSLINSKAFPSDTTALSVITTDRTLYTVTVPAVTVTTSLLEVSSNSASTSTPISSTVIPTSSAASPITSTVVPTQSTNVESAHRNSSGSDKTMTISLAVILPLFFLLPIALCLWNRYKHKDEESAKRRSARSAPGGGASSSEMNQIPLVRTWPGEDAGSREYQTGRHHTTNSNGEQLLAVPYSAPRENLSSNIKKVGEPAVARDSTFSALISTGGKSPRDANTPPIRPERPDGMTGLTNAEISAVASTDPYGYKHLAHVRKHSSPAHELGTGQNNPGLRSERPENISEERQDESEADQQSERLTQYNFSPSYSLASHNSWDRQAHPPTMSSAYSPPPLRIVKQRDVQQQPSPDGLAPPPIPEKSIRRSGTFPNHNKQREIGPTRFGPTLASSEQIREENRYAAEYEREDGTMSPVPTADERQMRHDRTLAYLAGKTPGGNDYRASSIYSRDEYGTPTPVKGGQRRRDDDNDDDNVYRYRPKPDWL